MVLSHSECLRPLSYSGISPLCPSGTLHKGPGCRQSNCLRCRCHRNNPDCAYLRPILFFDCWWAAPLSVVITVQACAPSAWCAIERVYTPARCVAPPPACICTNCSHARATAGGWVVHPIAKALSRVAGDFLGQPSHQHANSDGPRMITGSGVLRRQRHYADLSRVTPFPMVEWTPAIQTRLLIGTESESVFRVILVSATTSLFPCGSRPRAICKLLPRGQLY